MSKRNVEGVVLKEEYAEPSEEELFGVGPSSEEAQEELLPKEEAQDQETQLVQDNESTPEATEEQKARSAQAVQDKRETVRRILDQMLSTQAEVTKLDLRLGNEDMVAGFWPSLDRKMPAVQESVYIQVKHLRESRVEKINDIGRFRAAITLMVE